MHQSNLVKGRIAFRFYSPGVSSSLHLHVSAGDLTLKSSLPWWGRGSATPSYTVCYWTQQVYLPNGIWIRWTV